MRQMYSYWQLKRQWRFGVPLLRRFVSAQQDANKVTLLKQKLAQSLGKRLRLDFITLNFIVYNLHESKHISYIRGVQRMLL